MTDQTFPIELTPPDIAPYRHGNTGIDYVTTFESGEPGPHVVINALIHGNELCGAIAVDALFRLGVRPLRGTLTLALANVEAYRAFDPERPFASRFIDEDMNRIWAADPLESPRDSVELRRARELLPVYERADILLDLHSMTGDTDPMTLCGRTARGRRLALALGHPSWVVADGGHAAGRRLLDCDGFAREPGERTALLVECGQHWRAATATVAVETCLRLLLVQRMIDPRLADGRMPHRTEPPTVVEVTHTVTAARKDFTFAEPYVGLEVIPHAGTTIGFDGPVPVVTPYDDCVLIMPARRVKPGQTAVRLGRVAGR